MLAAWRLARLALHFASGLITCATLFPFLGFEARMRRVRIWSARLVAICGIRIESAGEALGTTKALVVSNHISWLDIFVINSIVPCRFVAKADIRDWPLIGWLCAKTGTIFIARGRLRDVRRIFEDLVRGLHAGEHVAFFPEGTTAPQGSPLSFHANLFEAAIDAKVPVQPFALAYVDRDGRYHPAADFIGETTFMDSVVAILGSRGMTVRIAALPRIAVGSGSHRRELAEAAHQAVLDGLARLPQIEPGR